jgi:hypothetical protein
MMANVLEEMKPVSNILAKLGVSNRAEAITLALRKKISLVTDI